MSLSEELGVSQPTLSRWLRNAHTLGGMSKNNKKKRSPQSATRRTAEDKFRILLQAASLSGEALGEFLRKEGVHTAELEEWREKSTGALKDLKRKKSEQTPEARKIRELESELRRKEKALAEAAALLVLQKKKSAGVLGGKGRRHGHEERDMILGIVAEAVENGASEKVACETVGVSVRSLQRWREQGVGDDNRAGPASTPGNKLLPKERQKVLSVLNSEEYRDLSPWQIVAKLADQGLYLASESTMYRILHEENQQQHRERSREPQERHRPKELVATAPNQVWSWDITYLASPVRGAFFYAYMVIDVFSRKVVGFAVHDRECGDLAMQLLDSSCRREGVRRDQLVIHSDNGGPMKSATLLATLLALGVATSFSRPSVSNDNPFSESAFRTAKYRPEYPKGPFASLDAARKWFDWFVGWYNTEHQHSGIRFVTPEDRHTGRDVEVLENRARVYAAAKARNPERWTGATRDWSRIDEVRLNPNPNSADTEAA